MCACGPAHVMAARHLHRRVPILFCLILAAGLSAHAQTKVLFSDDFAQGTNLWTEVVGTWAELPGGLRSDDRYVSELVGGHPDWADVSFEAAFQLVRPLTASDNIKLFFRWQGQWHGYGLLFDASGTRLVRFEGGPGQFQMLAQSAFVPGRRAIAVRVDMQGRRMTAYINDTPILQGMDPVWRHRTARGHAHEIGSYRGALCGSRAGGCARPRCDLLRADRPGPDLEPLSAGGVWKVPLPSAGQCRGSRCPAISCSSTPTARSPGI